LDSTRKTMSSIHVYPQYTDDDTDKFVQDVITRHSSDTVSSSYTDYLFSNDNIFHAFLCKDKNFHPKKSLCALTYVEHWDEEKGEQHYYILLFCTAKRQRGKGYGSTLLTKFIEQVREETRGSNIPTKIMLSSLESAVEFYEKYGFRWIYPIVEDEHEALLRYEHCYPGKEHFIMELDIV